MINPDECTGTELIQEIIEVIAENDGEEVGLPTVLINPDTGEEMELILVCRLEMDGPELTSETPMVVH